MLSSSDDAEVVVQSVCGGGSGSVLAAPAPRLKRKRKRASDGAVGSEPSPRFCFAVVSALDASSRWHAECFGAAPRGNGLATWCGKAHAAFGCVDLAEELSNEGVFLVGFVVVEAYDFNGASSPVAKRL